MQINGNIDVPYPNLRLGGVGPMVYTRLAQEHPQTAAIFSTANKIRKLTKKRSIPYIYSINNKMVTYHPTIRISLVGLFESSYFNISLLRHQNAKTNFNHLNKFKSKTTTLHRLLAKEVENNTKITSGEIRDVVDDIRAKLYSTIQLRECETLEDFNALYGPGTPSSCMAVLRGGGNIKELLWKHFAVSPAAFYFYAPNVRAFGLYNDDKLVSRAIVVPMEDNKYGHVSLYGATSTYRLVMNQMLAKQKIVSFEFPKKNDRAGRMSVQILHAKKFIYTKPFDVPIISYGGLQYMPFPYLDTVKAKFRLVVNKNKTSVRVTCCKENSNNNGVSSGLAGWYRFNQRH